MNKKKVLILSAPRNGTKYVGKVFYNYVKEHMDNDAIYIGEAIKPSTTRTVYENDGILTFERHMEHQGPKVNISWKEYSDKLLKDLKNSKNGWVAKLFDHHYTTLDKDLIDDLINDPQVETVLLYRSDMEDVALSGEMNERKGVKEPFVVHTTRTTRDYLHNCVWMPIARKQFKIDRIVKYEDLTGDFESDYSKVGLLNSVMHKTQQRETGGKEVKRNMIINYPEWKGNLNRIIKELGLKPYMEIK